MDFHPDPDQDKAVTEDKCKNEKKTHYITFGGLNLYIYFMGTGS